MENLRLTELRSKFPQLGEKVYGKPLVYLDNAATSMRPQSVLDCWMEMSVGSNANPYRAVHLTSDKATTAMENAREAVRKFIGAPESGNIVFTYGTTSSINLVASSFGEKFIGPGDEVIVAGSEHHSDIVPWQMVCERKGAVIKVLPVKDDGTLDVAALDSLLSQRTRIVCVAQVSNVLGIINPLGEIISKAHGRNVPVLVDGAQGILHGRVDVRELDCDFYAFSGHKIFAATGVGVLYAKKRWLEQMPPYMGGGEMISTVRWSGTTYAEPPHKFEAGTMNVAGVPTLVPALELASEVNRSEEVAAEQEKIVSEMLRDLPKIGGLRLFGGDVPGKVALFSMAVEGVHHEDLALLLDKMGVAVRSGQMCAEPLMDRFGVTGMLRASFAPYNTLEDARYFIGSLGRAVEMLRK